MKVRFETEPPETVVTARARADAGLDHWIDGSFGLLRDGTRTRIVSPNGPELAIHDVEGDLFGAWSGAQLVDGLATAGRPIEGLPAEIAHASGGPLFTDPATGLTLLVYHGETFHDGDWERFWSYIGLAVSDDGATTFRDLGPVVESDIRPEETDRLPVEIGPGGGVVHDGHLVLYFTDRTTHAQPLRLGAARAPFHEVVAAALDGGAAAFSKYLDGEFASPGLGGRATELMGAGDLPVMWFDLATVVTGRGDEELFLIVFSTFDRSLPGHAGWGYYGACSRDGITWSEPAPLHTDGFRPEMLYVTVDSGGPEQRRIEGDAFDLYTVVAAAEYRWDDARVERVRVRFRLSD